MHATCPACETSMPLDGHAPGKVVRCACEALLFVTAQHTLEPVPHQLQALAESLRAYAADVRRWTEGEISIDELESYLGRLADRLATGASWLEHALAEIRTARERDAARAAAQDPAARLYRRTQ